MTNVFLLLGSNEGDKAGWLKFAVEEVSAHAGHVIKTSSVYETAAWGNTEQPPFYNMAVEITTELSPLGLLAETQAIEAKAGRNRTVKWGQRTLDIDLLFYGDIAMNTEALTLPHPHLHQRRFTLAPLAEIATEFVHPVLNKTIAQLYEECIDPLPVTKLNSLAAL